MGTLEGEVQLLKDKVARREQRARLAEREVGFLQALVVRTNTLAAVTLLTIVQASFTAEDQAARDVPTSDSGLSQRVQHLEQSLSEYKTANSQLQQVLDAIDNEDAGSTRLSRKELRQRMEYHKGTAEEATKGDLPVSVPDLMLTRGQLSKRSAVWPRCRQTRLKSWNRRCLSYEARLVRGTTSRRGCGCSVCGTIPLSDGVTFDSR